MEQALNFKITPKSVLKFTLPSIVMMVVMSFYTIVDGTFVSNLIGTDAFSAVNIVYPLISVIIAIGTMFGTGITAIVSQKMGEGNFQEARKHFTFILAFSIGTGILISVLSLIFLNPLISFLGADETVFQYCYDYAFPILFFFPFSILQLEFQSLFVAEGKPALGLITTLIGGIANIVLDYLFIAVFSMGIAGAAIATGIGYAIPAGFGVFYFFLHRTGNLYFTLPKWNSRVLLHTVTNGSSEMVTNLSTSITTLLFNKILMDLIGSDGVAAVSILFYLDFILVAICLGYSMGVAPLFSFHYGSKNKRKCNHLYRFSLKFVFLSSAVLMAGAMIFAGPLTSVFSPQDTPVYDLAVAGLRIYAVGYLFKSFSIFTSALFTAFGNGKVSAAVSFLRTLVFLVASLLILSALFGLNGVWWASPVAEFLSILVSLGFSLRYAKRYWAAPYENAPEKDAETEK